jgi:hypothetical protein
VIYVLDGRTVIHLALDDRVIYVLDCRTVVRPVDLFITEAEGFVADELLGPVLDVIRWTETPKLCREDVITDMTIQRHKVITMHVDLWVTKTIIYGTKLIPSFYFVIF